MGSRDVHKAEDACSSLGAPTNINPIQLDVTDDASINYCFKAIEQHFGRLDVLILWVLLPETSAVSET